MTALEHLDLCDNRFIGTLDSLVNLTALTYLDVDTNTFEGNLCGLAGMTRLTIGAFYENQFDGSLDCLSALTALQYFEIAQNQLTGTMDVAAQWAQLIELDLYHNSLSGTLAGVAHLTNLQKLQVNFNAGLTGSFDSVSRLVNLIWFKTGKCSFTGTLSPLRTLSRLQILHLHDNADLHGDLSPLAQLTALSELQASNNHFSGDLRWLRNLTSLTVLQLDGNGMSGDLSGLANLTALVRLDLHDQSVSFGGGLTGDLRDLHSLVHLEIADLSNNLLIGAVGSLFDTLPSTQLKQLSLAHNQLCDEGTLTIELSMFPQLISLNLSANVFSGELILPAAAAFQSRCVLDTRGQRFKCPMPPFPPGTLPLVEHCLQDYTAVGLDLLYLLLCVIVIGIVSLVTKCHRLPCFVHASSLSSWVVTMLLLVNDVAFLFRMASSALSQFEQPCDVINTRAVFEEFLPYRDSRNFPPMLWFSATGINVNNLTLARMFPDQWLLDPSLSFYTQSAPPASQSFAQYMRTFVKWADFQLRDMACARMASLKLQDCQFTRISLRVCVCVCVCACVLIKIYRCPCLCMCVMSPGIPQSQLMRRSKHSRMCASCFIVANITPTCVCIATSRRIGSPNATAHSCASCWP
jgi:Leucine-rich repeat (LRR) protein